MDFELVWHAMSPYCNFVFQSSTKKTKMIYCEFQSNQKNNVERKVTIKISDEVVSYKHTKASLALPRTK